MPGVVAGTHTSLHEAIARDGFAFVYGHQMRELLASYGSLSDWDAFSASWDHLALDPYMADGGRYRRRRHAVYTASAEGPIVREPHQAHYQSTDYNPLHGGVERWFEPVMPAAGESRSLQAILACSRSLFGSLAPAVRRWHIEVHQFRIEAGPGRTGRPTPEGLHRDGVDYVLVLLVSRRNIDSGTTAIHALDGRRLGQFTLTHPFDAALVHDVRVAHGVTPVEAVDPALPACRDVLVVTFTASTSGAAPVED
jgi:hypothetical protein